MIVQLEHEGRSGGHSHLHIQHQARGRVVAEEEEEQRLIPSQCLSCLSSSSLLHWDAVPSNQAYLEVVHQAMDHVVEGEEECLLVREEDLQGSIRVHILLRDHTSTSSRASHRFR